MGGFRWINCFADALVHRYRWMARQYVHDVVAPSLSQMQHRIALLRERMEDHVAIFGIQPAEELLRATVLGYCLSIQALWEK